MTTIDITEVKTWKLRTLSGDLLHAAKRLRSYVRHLEQNGRSVAELGAGDDEIGEALRLIEYHPAEPVTTEHTI